MTTDREVLDGEPDGRIKHARNVCYVQRHDLRVDEAAVASSNTQNAYFTSFTSVQYGTNESLYRPAITAS